MRSNTIIFILIFMAFSIACFASNFAIVVNPENQNDKMELSELKKIFLGKKINWDAGGKIKIAVLKEGELHKDFLQEILKMNPVQFSLVWKKKLFTGKNTQIRLFKDDIEIREYIKNEPYSIGYVAVTNVDGTVKKVEVIDTGSKD